MKTTKKTVAMFAVAAAATLSLGLVACGGKKNSGKTDPPEDPPHDCTQVCPDCGGCLDMVCDNSGCDTKCGDDYDFDATFDVVDLKVAKSNVTVVPTGYVTDFNKTAGGSIVYTFNASEAGKVTLEAYVNKSTERDLFTDVITVKVNDGAPLSRPSVIPALKEGEVAAASVTEINLGCIELEEGENTITFLANGDGAHAHNFYKVTIIGDGEYSLTQATQVEHVCFNVCDVCGYCTDFTCYNPGCADKCECVSDGLRATLFWVCDERVQTSRPVNAELDGIGCTWGQETRMVYNITADKAGTVKFGAVTSADSKSDVLFTDQFVVTVNGERVPAGTGCMPASESGGRDWNAYSLVVVGELTLKAGRNEIVVSQTPDHNKTNQAYNFQSLVIFGDGAYGWYTAEHKLTHVEAEDATCAEDGNKEYWVCSDCGKLFTDEYGETETTEDEVKVPSDPSKHVGDLDTDDMTVTCDECDTVLTGIVFSASHDRFLFSGTKKDGYCEGKNGTKTTVTLNVESDKAGIVKLYANDSSIINGWEVNFNNTWTVTVNGKEYTSKTVHHNTDGTGAAAADRFTDFHYEYVCDIELVAGENVIVFDSAGKSDELNLKDVALVGEDFDIDWYIAPSEYHAEVPSTCSTPGTKAYYLETATGKKYKDELLTQEYGEGELALPLDADAHTYGALDTEHMTVPCKECDAALEATNFNGMSDNCMFEGASKNASEQCLPGSNGKTTVITYHIRSDKAGTAKLYTNVSAISGGWEVRYDATWNVTVNGDTCPTDTIHHYENDGGKPAGVNRYNYYAYEYVCDVELVAGNNVIVFTATGKEALNFRDLAIAVDDLTLDWNEKYTPVVAPTCSDPGNIAYWTDSNGDKYADREFTTPIADEDIVVPADPTMHVGKLGEDGMTVSCEKCDTFMRKEFLVHDSRNVANKTTKAGEGIGSSWGSESRVTFTVYSPTAVETDLYAFISQDQKSYTFTDFINIYVNGSEDALATEATVEAHGGRNWTTFDMINVGKINLVAGENTIVVSFTPSHGDGATDEIAINFLKIALGSEGANFMYTPVAAVAETCSTAGNIAYYISTADGKKYSDKALTTGISDEDVVVPADSTKHVGELGEDGVTIACKHCDTIMGANFSGVDDNCVLVSSKSKEANNIPTLNAGDTITFKINASKAGTVKLYVNCSAISGSWNVEFYKTWGVTVNGTEYVSNTIHHNENDGGMPSGANKWSYYKYEFIADVELVEGENVIVFTATGSEVLNFKDMALLGDSDMELSWSVEQPEEIEQPEAPDTEQSEGNE